VFREYISEELASFVVGMSTAMKKCQGYVNVPGGIIHDLLDADIIWIEV
jgi:hypothetical protein